MLRAAGALDRFYEWRGRLKESVVAFEGASKRLTGMASPQALRARADMLRRVGASQNSLGDHEGGAQQLKEALAILERPELATQDTRIERALVLQQLATAVQPTDPRQYGRLFERSLAVRRAGG